MPHGQPSDATIEPGNVLLLDFGCTVDGYRSDMTRTLFVGDVPDHVRRAHDAVRAAQSAAIDAIAVGVNGREVDAIARRVITDAGFEPYGHGLGHGIGLEVHEPPSLRYSRAYTLEAGMVFSVEPGIYQPGVTGVRIEDIVVLEERTVRRMPPGAARHRLRPRRYPPDASVHQQEQRLISTGDVKKGVIIELDGQLMKVLDWSHIKMARGSAQVRMKLQNVRRGDIVERTFQAGTRWPRARVEQRNAQPLRRRWHVPLHGHRDLRPVRGRRRDARRRREFLLENTEVMVSGHGGVLGVELPMTVDLKVVETEPGFAGDTATGAKKAPLETGPSSRCRCSSPRASCGSTRATANTSRGSSRRRCPSSARSGTSRRPGGGRAGACHPADPARHRPEPARAKPPRRRCCPRRRLGRGRSASLVPGLRPLLLHAEGLEQPGARRAVPRPARAPAFGPRTACR